MREFFYKFIIIIVGLFFLYQFTIGYTVSKFQQKLYSLDFKDLSTNLKDKIREEIKKSLNKERVINKDDAIIIKNFIDKINKELKN